MAFKEGSITQGDLEEWETIAIWCCSLCSTERLYSLKYNSFLVSPVIDPEYINLRRNAKLCTQKPLSNARASQPSLPPLASPQTCSSPFGVPAPYARPRITSNNVHRRRNVSLNASHPRPHTRLSHFERTRQHVLRRAYPNRAE